jgi:carboxypeptidase T
MKVSRSKTLGALALLLLGLTAYASGRNDDQRFVQVDARTKESRTLAESLGMSIEFVRSDSAWGFADRSTIEQMKGAGLRILGDFDYKIGRHGHGDDGFPSEDERFHDYEELRAELTRMESENSEIAKVHVIGKSLEGRDILAIHVNTDRSSLEAGHSNKPGAIYLGSHHAREHLSTEIPLMFVDYLLKNKTDTRISALLDGRDLWVVPLVNPDGATYDLTGGDYHSWRKNRRDNGDGTYGVDLNRNYGFMWGTGGSSTNTNSEVYMGETPFSEPETQVIKAFVEDHLNAKVLLTFHTFSELILYPWGHTYDPLPNEKDRQTFEKMARTMAGWNKYTPQQSSDLYIASGDTVDWAYGTHGIFAFTFELSPASIFDGGFYPGQKAIDPTFAANLKPALYLLDLADDPYRALTEEGPTTESTPGSSWPGGIRARHKFDIHPIGF